MKSNDLRVSVQSSVDNLLRLTETYCWNKISGKVYYILSDFNEFEGENFKEQGDSRKRINNSKKLLNFDSAVEILHKEYHDLYDVNLIYFQIF